jgi:hypothetical protein
MGKYTASDDPIIEKTVTDHLLYIVNTILAHMDPQAIILRGSFGRGEGTVMVEGKKPCFLSDYEIDVATLSPFYRSLFSRLTRQVTTELGVDVGIRWVRPDYLQNRRIGPFLVGPLDISISSYESRYGSKVLYGLNIIDTCATIDPSQIPVESGIRLMFNRIAEALLYINKNHSNTITNLHTYYWINKTILACAESLLVLWKQYHFSYRERGLRFASNARKKLCFMQDEGAILCELVARATEYKLRPANGLYPLPVIDTWQRVIPEVEAIFRHLINENLQINFESYVDFPRQYLQESSRNYHSPSRKIFLSLKLLEIYRSLRVHYLPRSFYTPYHAYQVVYSIVPLLFFGFISKERAALLDVVRFWLSKLGPLKAPSADLNIEWDYLRQELFRYWKVYCHG